MNTHPLVAPVLAQIALTMLVWIYMYFVRIGYMVKNRIPASAAPNPQRVREVLPENINNPANNLNNLFEIPVLFFALCLLLIWSGMADSLTTTLAWAFVALRGAHSVVQSTFNHVMTRFVLYFVSCLALWVMLLRTIAAYWGAQ